MLCCCNAEDDNDDKLDLTNMGEIDIIEGGEIIEDYRYNNKNMYIILKNNIRFFIKEAFYNKETQNELFFIKKLNHENIIEFVNEQIKNKYCLIAMECLPMDLYSYINTIKKPIPNDSIEIIYRQLTNVIKYLHNIYICHGDIKLENIMVEPSSLSIKLIDFGYTRQYKSGDILTKENIGTFYYRSPESLLFTDSGYNPFKSEIWALGICLFILNEYRYPYFSDFGDLITRKPNRDVISNEFNKKLNYVYSNDYWRSIIDAIIKRYH